MMIKLIQVVVSTGKSKKVIMNTRDINRVEECEDARSDKIRSRIFYKQSQYQEGMMYVRDKIGYIYSRMEENEYDL